MIFYDMVARRLWFVYVAKWPLAQETGSGHISIDDSQTQNKSQESDGEIRDGRWHHVNQFLLKSVSFGIAKDCVWWTLKCFNYIWLVWPTKSNKDNQSNSKSLSWTWTKALFYPLLPSESKSFSLISGPTIRRVVLSVPPIFISWHTFGCHHFEYRSVPSASKKTSLLFCLLCFHERIECCIVI